MTWVGRSMRRVEDSALLRGQGRFVDDFPADLSARFIRSPTAAGTIRSVKAPEGSLVFTINDLDASGVGEIASELYRPDFVKAPQPLLARGRVRFVGEPVAVAVAASPEEAEDLAEHVELDIQPTQAVADIASALAEGAQPVHPEVADSNVVVSGAFATPGLSEALKTAHLVVEMDIVSGRQCALPLEGRGSRAETDPASARTTLYASVQSPHVVRTGICDLLGIPEIDLRVVAPDVGGAFGQKIPLAREDALMVWLSRRLQSSVAWVEDRVENLSSAWHCREQRYWLRGGFDSEGRFLALDADIACNVGAWSCFPITWGVEPLMALAELPGPYRVSEYGVRSRGVSTNTCPSSPYRGVSRPVLTLAVERLMDTAAGRLGLSSAEIRCRNLIEEFPHTSPTGLVHDPGSYRESLEAALAEFNLDGFRLRQSAARNNGDRLLGLGISVFAERTGYGTPAFAARGMSVTVGFENVHLEMDPSGSLLLRIGASPHGQGLHTSLSQIVADSLGVPPERVRVLSGDTDATPYGWGTFASRSVVLAGGAAYKAAQQMRRLLSELAAEELEAAPEDIVLADNRATVAGTTRGMGIPALARIAHYQSQRMPGGLGPGLRVQDGYDPPGTFSNACHVAEVEVDPHTGGVELNRFVVVEDAGRLINPMIVDGQIRGGVTQGIANALYEEVIYDLDGNILTTSLMDFLPPTVAEIPDIEIIHLETISDASITGAKGLGEGGTIGAPAAVINAINDAIAHLGVAINEMPATPEKVLAAIHSAPGVGLLADAAHSSFSEDG